MDWPLILQVSQCAHLLKRVDFDAIEVHLAIVHILKSKTEPATTRIERLLEVLSAYSFNLYYMKGKYMILSDFLSRQRIDRSSPHEIIPISFDMKAILKDKYYNVGKESKYLVHTHSQIKDGGIKPPEVQGAEKGVDPDLKPEWIVRKSQKWAAKSRLEQDREDPSVQGQTQFIKENHVREQLVSEQGKNTSAPQVNQDTNRGIEQGRDMTPKHIGSPQVTEIQTTFYPDPVMKPPPIPPDKIAQNDRQINLDLDLEIYKDFEENSPYQEGVISEIYQRPDKSQLVEPPELTDLVDTDKIVQKYIPKQTDIDKILKVIQRKVLKGTHLPVTIKGNSSRIFE